MSAPASRIYCDRAQYNVVGSVSEIEHVISFALEETGTPRSPFVYLDLVTPPDKQVCVNANKVSVIEPTVLD
jgi:hypothetical protein